ncbi:CBS domain-containing protein [Actinoplanes sp. NPDC049316]|uniref:CBS domain-containing protein n=1 Tax=Actinoplanes sp. NPDC049316 TaxID=3154727 RepID=UPI003445BCA5
MKTWTVDDVMTVKVVCARVDTPYREAVDLVMGRHVDALPVVDEQDHVVGVVSEADLLHKIERSGVDDRPRLFESRRHREERAKAAAHTAGMLMTSPAVTVPAGTPIAAAARLMVAVGVEHLPVIDDRGHLAGIVSRGDLLKVHLRPDADLVADVWEMLRRVPGADEKSVEVSVHDGVVKLSGRLERRSATLTAVALAAQIPGVADVADELGYEFDDSAV